TRYPLHPAGGPQVPGGAAGDPGGAAYVEPDPGAASACALPGDGWGPHGGRAVESGAQWVLVARAGGDGGVSGQAARRDPAGPGAGGAAGARGDAAPAGAEPAAPAGSPAEDDVERAHPGALPAWGGGGDVSSPLPAWWPHQERPAGGLRWQPGHLHLSSPAGGGRRRQPSGPAPDVIGGRLLPAVAPACAGAADAGGAVLWPVP